MQLLLRAVRGGPAQLLRAMVGRGAEALGARGAAPPAGVRGAAKIRGR